MTPVMAQDIIRAGTLEDAAGIARLLHKIEGLGTIGSEAFEMTLARVRTQFSTIINSQAHTLLVSAKNDIINAYISVHWHPTFLQADGEGFVSELFVIPEMRSQGIGTRLLECIKNEAKKRGCARLSLLNMRHKASYERAYYQNLNWTERPNAANFILDLKGDS